MEITESAQVYLLESHGAENIEGLDKSENSVTVSILCYELLQGFCVKARSRDLLTAKSTCPLAIFPHSFFPTACGIFLTILFGASSES